MATSPFISACFVGATAACNREYHHEPLDTLPFRAHLGVVEDGNQLGKRLAQKCVKATMRTELLPQRLGEAFLVLENVSAKSDEVRNLLFAVFSMRFR